MWHINSRYPVATASPWYVGVVCGLIVMRPFGLVMYSPCGTLPGSPWRPVFICRCRFACADLGASRRRSVFRSRATPPLSWSTTVLLLRSWHAITLRLRSPSVVFLSPSCDPSAVALVGCAVIYRVIVFWCSRRQVVQHNLSPYSAATGIALSWPLLAAGGFHPSPRRGEDDFGGHVGCGFNMVCVGCVVIYPSLYRGV